MAKARHARLDPNRGCMAEATLALIAGKWKCVILWHLLNQGGTRYSDFKRRFEDVTSRVLSNQLRELELDGLIERRLRVGIPPIIDYQLTGRGHALAPVLGALTDWGESNADLLAALRSG